MPEDNRHRRISRWQLLRKARRWAFAGVLSAALGAYSFLETRWLTVYPSEVTIPGLPEAFDRLRVVQLTDIHHGPFLSIARVKKAVRLANSLHPDVILLTGDYVHRHRRYIAPCQRALAGLKAPLGVYAVLGNHDYWEGAAETHAGMKRAGIVEVTNANRRLERSGESLWIAGVGDLWEDEQRLDRALAGVPADGTALLLSHNPDYNEQMDDRRVELMLCGHTHGGQVALPFVGPPIVPSRFGQKYAAGLVRDDWKQVYISRGVGTITPPVRSGCRPEVTLLTLRRSPQ